MAEKRYKRRRVLIDRRQFQLLGVTALYFVATAAIFAATLFGPLLLQLAGDDPPPLEQATVADEFLTLHARFWPALLVTFVLLSVHSVFTSHRIVGPLYRFRTVFKEVQEGNLVPWITLRRRDLLVREATALDEMVTSLRERIARMAGHQRTARRELAAPLGVAARHAGTGGIVIAAREEADHHHRRRALPHRPHRLTSRHSGTVRPRPERCNIIP